MRRRTTSLPLYAPALRLEEFFRPRHVRRPFERKRFPSNDSLRDGIDHTDGEEFRDARLPTRVHAALRWKLRSLLRIAFRARRHKIVVAPLPTARRRDHMVDRQIRLRPAVPVRRTQRARAREGEGQRQRESLYGCVSSST